jgi:hypothetical protein
MVRSSHGSGVQLATRPPRRGMATDKSPRRDYRVAFSPDCLVHLRRKSNDEMARLYDVIAKLAPAGASETSREDAPLFSEDAEAALAAMEA